MKKLILVLGILVSSTLVSCEVIDEVKSTAGEISEAVDKVKDTVEQLKEDLEGPMEEIKKLQGTLSKLNDMSGEVLEEVENKEPVVLTEDYTWREFLADYESELDTFATFTNSVDIDNLGEEESEQFLRSVLMLGYWQENSELIMEKIPQEELEEYGIELVKVVNKLKECFPEGVE